MKKRRYETNKIYDTERNNRMKMTRRIFSLVLAMMMLVGTMFAIPAAAHDHADCEECVVYTMVNEIGRAHV